MSSWARIQEILDRQRLEREAAEVERKRKEAELEAFRARQQETAARMEAMGAPRAGAPTPGGEALARAQANVQSLGARPADEVVDDVARQSFLGSGNAGLIEQTARNAAANLASRGGSYVAGAAEMVLENPWTAGAAGLALPAGARDKIESGLQQLRERQNEAAGVLQAPQAGVFDKGLPLVERLKLAASKTASALPAASLDVSGGMLTGGVAPALTMAADEYHERRDEGDSKLRALAGAAPVGVLSGTLERIGAKGLVAPAKSTLSRLAQGARAANVEGLTEAGETATQLVSRAALGTEAELEKGNTWSKRWREFASPATVRALGESYVVGVGAGAAIKGSVDLASKKLQAPERAKRLSEAVGGAPAVDAETAWRHAVAARAVREELVKAGANPAELAELGQDIDALEAQAGEFAVRQLQQVAPEASAEAEAPAPTGKLSWDQYAAVRPALLERPANMKGYRETAPNPASPDPVAELERWAAPLRPASPIARLRAIASATGIPESRWKSRDPAQAPQGESAIAGMVAGTGKAWTRAQGLEGSASMPDRPNDRVRYHWVLAEANDIIASHDPGFNPRADFPQQLQTRDRTGPALREQALEIARDPKLELVSDNPLANFGAPMVGPDRVVELGNGRTLGLQTAYASGTAAKYRADLEAAADRYGFTSEQVRQMKQPVLVRERIGDLDLKQRAELAIRLNSDPQASMDVTEVAKGDAMRIDDSLLASLRDSDLSDPANGAFIDGFIRKVVSPNELQRFVDENKRPSAQLYERATMAVLARAYPDGEILRRMAKDSEPLGRRFARGLLAVAPRVAQYRADVATGRRQPGLDWYAPIIQVAARFDAWGNSKQPGSVSEKAMAWLGQIPLEQETPSQQAERELISVMLADKDLQDGRKIKALGRVLNHMADRVDSVNPLDQASLFGGGPQGVSFGPNTVVELFKMAQEDYRAEVDGQGQGALFSGGGAGGEIVSPVRVIADPENRTVVTRHEGVSIDWKGSTWAVMGDVEVRLSGRGGISIKAGGSWQFYPGGLNDLPTVVRDRAEAVLRTIEGSGGNLRQGLASPEVKALDERLLVDALRETESALVSVGTSQRTARAIAALSGTRARVWAESQQRPAFEMFSAAPVVIGNAPMVSSATVSAFETALAASAARTVMEADPNAAGVVMPAAGLLGVGLRRNPSFDNTVLHEMTHVWWHTLTSAEREAFGDLQKRTSGDERTAGEEFVAVVERAIVSGAAPSATTGAGQVLLGNAFAHLRDVASHWHYDPSLPNPYQAGEPAKGDRSKAANEATAMLWATERLRQAPEPYWSQSPDPGVGWQVVDAIDRGDLAAAEALAQSLPPEAAGPFMGVMADAKQQGAWPLAHQLDDVVARTGMDPMDVEAVDIAIRQVRARKSALAARGALELISDDGEPLFSMPVQYQQAAAVEQKDANPNTKAALSPPKNLPLWQRVAAGMRARGYLPEAAFDLWKRATWKITGEVMEAERVAGQWMRELDRVAKERQLRPTTARRAMMLALETGAVSEVTAFGDRKLYQATMSMRDHIDRLTDRMLETPGMVDPDLRSVLENNRGKYVHRTYRYHTDTLWREGIEQSREWARAVEWWHDNRLFPDLDVNEEGIAAAAGQADPQQIRRAENHLRAWLINGGLDAFGQVTGRKGGDRTAFWKRDNVPEQLRAVLGEERNPELAYVASVTSMIDALTKYETFSFFAQHFDGVVVSREPTSTLNIKIDGKSFKPLSGEEESVQYTARAPQVRDKVRLVDPGASSAPTGSAYVVVSRAKGAESTPHPLGGLEGDMLTVVQLGTKGTEWTLPAQSFRTEDGSVAIVGGGAIKKVVRDASPPYYTSPEIAAWLEGESPGAGGMAAATQAYLAINGAIKGGKVVLSPSTQARNFLSNTFIALSSGLLTPRGFVDLLTGDHNSDTWRAFVAKDPAAISDWVVKAARYGALQAGATAADIQAYRDQLAGVLRVDMPTPTLAAKAATVLDKGMKLAEGFYQAGDSWWKLWAFRQWSERLAAANGREKPTEADYVDAGRRVNETFPSTDNTASVVNLVRKLPVIGSYPSFFYLATRSLFQTAKQASRDIRSGVPGIQRMGVQSALGLVGSMTLPTAIPLLLRALLRTSEEDEDLVRRIEKSWSEAGDLQHVGGTYRRDNELVMLGRDGFKVRFQDLSWLDPFTSVRKPLLVLFRRALEGSDSETEWSETMARSVDAATAPYLDLEMTFQTAVSVLSNKRLGRASGVQVFNPEEDLTRKALAVVQYVARQIAPGGLRTFEDFWLAYTKEPQGSSGRVVSVSDALLGTVGIKTSTTDLEIHLVRTAYDYRDREQNARRIYTEGRLQASSQENLNNLVRANAAAKRVWDDLQIQVETARRLGISDTMIAAALRKERTPPRRVLGAMVFDDELKESIATLRAMGMDDKAVLGVLKDTGGSRAPFTQAMVERVLANQWQPLKFETR